MANFKSDDRPLVSVVIPAYNCERYIHRAIDSVLAQTYRPLECIVVDDGSTDGTSAIAQGFGDQVRLVRQSNGGASSARNAGIAAARGRYIAFLDSDDYWFDTKLDNQLAVFERHPEVVLVSGRWRWIPSSAEVAPDSLTGPAWDPGQVKIRPGLKTLLRDPYLCTPSVVIDASAAKSAGGFDPALPTAEDVDFFLRACGDRPYALLDQIVVACQIRPGSLTQTEDAYRFNLQVIDRLVGDQPHFARRNSELVAECRLDIYRRWVLAALFKGEGRHARDLLRRSRAVGHLERYGRLYAKSFLAPVIRWIRDRVRPDAHEVQATQTPG